MLGLEFFSRNQSDSSVKKAIKSILPHRHIVSANTLKDLEGTLLASCAGFPKLHRVWEYVYAYVFPFTKGRVMSNTR